MAAISTYKRNFIVRPDETLPYENLVREVASLDRSKHYVVTLREGRSKASDRQRGYLWAGVYPHISEFWHEHRGVKLSEEQVHEVFKELLPQDIIYFRGKWIKAAKSTSALNTKEFAEYIDHVIAPAMAEEGCIIPEPDWDYKRKKVKSED